MKRFLYKKYVACISILFFSAIHAAASTDTLAFWKLPALPAIASADSQQAWIRPALGDTLELDYPKMLSILQGAPDENDSSATLISLPIGSGQYTEFYVTQVPVMEEALTQQFPSIKTFKAFARYNNQITARLDIGPSGFHAMIKKGDTTFFVDPYSEGNTSVYSFYSNTQFFEQPDIPINWVCGYDAAAQASILSTNNVPNPESTITVSGGLFSGPTGDKLRTYRIAVAANSGFISFYGDVSSALQGIVTGINRLNTVYERDVGIRLILTGNTTSLLLPSNNPFDGLTPQSSFDTFIITETINTLISSNSYDIGHLVTTDGGSGSGLAFVGVVCDDFLKGSAISASATPRNDPFWLRLVAHEIGHQFSARHTWNGKSGACGVVTPTTLSAYELGSGSTIMSYAGICSADDLQGTSDPFFHSHSIDQMYFFSRNFAVCSVDQNPLNQAPIARAGSDFNIPSQTPFTLNGVASDANSDRLTFSWEQFDLGPPRSLSEPDDGRSPLFRVFPPTTSPSRTFPEWSDILSGVLDPTERLPTESRSMNFNFVVRDNNPAVGAVDVDEIILSVDGDTGPFAFTAPTNNVTVTGVYSVVWDVAGTDAPKFNASEVDILLSLDGGNNFVFPLVVDTPNDGSEAVVFPNINHSNVRMLLRVDGNIFFAVSEPFSIAAVGAEATVLFVSDEPVLVDDNNAPSGNGNNNQAIDPGERSVKLQLPIENIGSGFADNTIGQIVALTPNVVIDVDTAVYAGVPPNATVVNTTDFEISVPSSHPCGDPIRLLMNVQSDQGSNLVIFDLETGANGLCSEVSGQSLLRIDDFVDSVDPLVLTNELTYTVTIKNSGLDATVNSYVGFGISPRMSIESSTLNCPFDGLAVGCLIAGLSPNASMNLDFKVIMNASLTGQVYVVAYVFNDAANRSFFTDSEYESTFIADSNSNGIPDFAEMDIDDDGLPNAWEKQYFASAIDANPDLDSDWDGLLNGEEYIAGTHPNNPDSHLWVEAHMLTPAGDYILKWPAVDGREYAVYGAVKPGAPWTLLEESITPTIPWNEYHIPTTNNTNNVFCIGVKLLSE